MIEIRAAVPARRVRRSRCELQKVIWGFADIELLPCAFWWWSARSAATSSAPSTAREMVGFCFAIPGREARRPSPICTATCWACCRSIATRGIGRRLKLRQREDALARGIDLIEWTFDPLELKNAFFNIERLGAIVRRYVRESVRHHREPAARRPADRPLHRRVVDLDSPRVQRGAGRASRPSARAVEERIAYPADIARIRADRSASARARSSSAIGEQFQRRVRARASP